MTYLDALFKRLNRQKRAIVLLVAALVLTLANPLVACASTLQTMQVIFGTSLFHSGSSNHQELVCKLVPHRQMQAHCGRE